MEAVINDVIASIQYTVDSGQTFIYPNPVSDEFTIHDARFTIGTAMEISIYNLVGEKISSEVYTNPKEVIHIDCRNLLSGMYYLQLSLGEKNYRTKFVKH